MSLAEAQEFYFDLCSNPKTIRQLRENRERVFKKYFKSAADRKELSKYALERYQTYRNHVAFGILGDIATAFPVLYSFFTKNAWNELLNDFYLKRLTQSHIARHVYFEFSQYLQTIKGPLLKKIPYLHELAEYENLDLQLYFAKDVVLDLDWVTNAPEDPLELIPVLNPHLELRVYRWPVHTMIPGKKLSKEIKPAQHPIIVYRHPETLQVGFIEGNPLFADLIELIRPRRRSIQSLIQQLAKKHGIPEEKKKLFYEEAIKTIGFLRQQGLIVGMVHKKRRPR